jgi:rhodanese-related sulfurtransferase
MRKDNLTAIQDRIYDRIARMMSALSAPARLMLIHILSQGPQSVETLSRMGRLSVANTSQHLQKMMKEGIVDVSRSGVSRIYRLKSPSILSVWEELQDLAHALDPQLNLAESTLGNPDFVSPLTLSEIKKRISNKNALLLDVRTRGEALSTPIPNSINIPQDQLHLELKKINKKKPIYVICRGRYCATATLAVDYLRHRGFLAYRIKESPFRFSDQ